MAYKYPICDVFHWFCKIARFRETEPEILFLHHNQKSKAYTLVSDVTQNCHL